MVKSLTNETPWLHGAAPRTMMSAAGVLETLSWRPMAPLLLVMLSAPHRAGGELGAIGRGGHHWLPDGRKDAVDLHEELLPGEVAVLTQTRTAAHLAGASVPKAPLLIRQFIPQSRAAAQHCADSDLVVRAGVLRNYQCAAKLSKPALHTDADAGRAGLRDVENLHKLRMLLKKS
jgi:hypothetical protein